MTFRKHIGDSKMFEYDRHYRECQQLNKPSIKSRINPKKENYLVQIDLMTCNYDLSKKDQDEIKNMLENEITFVESNLNSKFDGFCIGKEFAWFDGISVEHVHDFCDCLYDLIQKHH